jgi:hypothetical protein
MKYRSNSNGVMALGICLVFGILVHAFTRNDPSSMGWYAGIGFMILGALPFFKKHWSAGTDASKAFSTDATRRLAKFQGMLCLLMGFLFIIGTFYHTALDQKIYLGLFILVSILFLLLQKKIPFLR